MAYLVHESEVGAALGGGTAASATLTTLDAAFTAVLRVDPTSSLATTPTISLADGSSVPNPAFQDAQTLPNLAGQVDAGLQTLTQTLNTIEHYGDTTTSVATIAYQFFTNATPSSGGYDYLVNSAANPDNLNTAYYAKFNEENRYINFAVNLGKDGAGQVNFGSNYGSLSLPDAMTKAYTAIFGFTPAPGKIAALLSASVGPNETRQDYFASYGGDGLGGIGTKAAAVGWLMAAAVEADLGVYAAANDQFLGLLAGGTGIYNVNLLTTFAVVTAGEAAAMEAAVTAPGSTGVSSLTGPLSVVDSAASVEADLDALQALAAGSRLTSVSLTDSPNATLTITAAQTADAGAIGAITSAYHLTVTGALTAAQAVALSAVDAHLTGAVSVVDTAANVAANLTGLNAEAKFGSIASIALTDVSTPTISLTAADATADVNALGDITSAYHLNVTTALSVAQASGLPVGVSAHLSAFTVSDTLADIGTDLNALEVYAKAGTLTGIAVTDVGQTITIPASQYAADIDAINLMSGSFTINQGASGHATIVLSGLNGTPLAFQDALIFAAQYFENLITDPITINITVTYGGLPHNVLGEGGPSGRTISYSQLTAALIAAGDTAQLPATDPSGATGIFVANAELKALGLTPASTADDGHVYFSSTFNSFNFDTTNRAVPGMIDFVGVAEHELSHALGRLSGIGDVIYPTVLDLFRFAAPGLLSTRGGYFSVDGGVTSLGAYDLNSDPGDWAHGTGPDANDAFASTGVANRFTAVDITQLNALGFSTAPGVASASIAPTAAAMPGAVAEAVADSAPLAGLQGAAHADAHSTAQFFV
jgi:hypothetical protein